MNLLKRNDILSIYNSLISHAEKYVREKNYLKALRELRASAKWAYNFNDFYFDCKAENLLKQIAEENFKECQLVPIKGRYILLDTNCTDNRGLVQQYQDAIKAQGKDLFYIRLDRNEDKCKKLLLNIREYSRGRLLSFRGHKLNDLQQAAEIIAVVKEYRPERIFLHLMPWDVVSLMVVHTMKGVLVYNINLTDHAYWLGASFIDYNIEFRAYGKTVSLEKRFLKPEQLLELPFYPIISQAINFVGFPNLPDDAIIVFTGGAPYKMMDKNDFFFLHILDGILSLAPQIVVLIAGFPNGNDLLNKKKTRMRYGDRVYNIGIRQDINEVFKRCDIYCGTYPITGGLMAQYAASNGKPILAFADKEMLAMNDVADFVNHFSTGVKTYTELEPFLNYAKCLIFDEKFRRSEGLRNAAAIMKKDNFDVLFPKLIQTHQNNFHWLQKEISYEDFAKLYLDVENFQMHSGIRMLIGSYYLGVLPRFWKYRTIVFPLLCKQIVSYICKFSKKYCAIL